MSILWTKEEDKTVKEWAESESPDRSYITRTIGRSWDAVRHRLERRNIKAPPLVLTPSLIDPKDPKDNETITRLQEQIKELTERKKIVIHGFFGKRIRIGVISDTHLGSLYERLDILEAAYDCFQEEGIKDVYHAGDVCDGENMFYGHVYEIAVHGADAQVRHCIENYPHREGITTRFITGSHDLSFWKRSGNDIGEKIARERKDMVYLGKESVDILMGKGKLKVQMEIVHPGKGTAYALSYHPQKHIEALSGGQKPHIVLMGHYHKAELIPSYRNVFLLQTGCCQSQTGFMKRRNLAAHMGYWILDFTINQPDLISRFKSEFFAVYESKEIAIV